MSGKMSSHSCPEASNKAVQVSNDIFALPPLMLSHGGTRGGGELEGMPCAVWQTPSSQSSGVLGTDCSFWIIPAWNACSNDFTDLNSVRALSKAQVCCLFLNVNTWVSQTLFSKSSLPPQSFWLVKSTNCATMCSPVYQHNHCAYCTSISFFLPMPHHLISPPFQRKKNSLEKQFFPACVIIFKLMSCSWEGV